MWGCGYLIMIMAAIVHTFVLPYADLTLLATTQATGIVAGVLLSICWLKEPVNMLFDLPALILMICGSISLVCVTNKSATFYATNELRGLMTTLLAKVYYFMLITAIICAITSYRWVMSKLAQLETCICIFHTTRLAVPQS